MPGLARLIGDLGALGIERARAGVFSALVSVMLLAIAALLCVIGVAFLLAGAYASLAAFLPAWQAGGIVALAALLIASIVVLWAQRRGAAARAGALQHRQTAAALRPHANPFPARELGPDAPLREAAEQGFSAAARLARTSVRHTDLAIAAFIAGLVLCARSRKPRTARHAPDE